MNIYDLEDLLKDKKEEPKPKENKVLEHIQQHRDFKTNPMYDDNYLLHIDQHSVFGGIHPPYFYQELAAKIQGIINRCTRDGYNTSELISSVFHADTHIINVDIQYQYEEINVLGRTEVVDIVPTDSIIKVRLDDNSVMEFRIRL